LLSAYLLYRFHQRKELSKSFQMTRVTAAEAVRMMQAPKKPVLLDVRSAVARDLDRRRLRGAIHVDIGDLDTLAKTIPKDDHLIVFCACPNEVSAAYMALQLRELGYRSVSPLKNGIDGWSAAGLPVDTDAASCEMAAARYALS
jgi:rhodanese-related sulfurtransferase